MAPAAAKTLFLSPRLLPEDLVEAEATAEVDREILEVPVAEAEVADAADDNKVADEGLLVPPKPSDAVGVDRTCNSMKRSNASIAGQVEAP